MKIEKKAFDVNNAQYKEYFYSCAREGMYDVVCEMQRKFQIDNILLPAYIGWSPKEGSGIFDAISSVGGKNKILSNKWRLNNK